MTRTVVGSLDFIPELTHGSSIKPESHKTHLGSHASSRTLPGNNIAHLNLCQLLSKTRPVLVLSLELLQSHLLHVGLHLLGALLTPLLLQLVQPGVQLQTELQTLASKSGATQAAC